MAMANTPQSLPKRHPNGTAAFRQEIIAYLRELVNKVAPSKPNIAPEAHVHACYLDLCFGITNQEPQNVGRWLQRCNTCTFFQWVTPAIPQRELQAAGILEQLSILRAIQPIRRNHKDVVDDPPSTPATVASAQTPQAIGPRVGRDQRIQGALAMTAHAITVIIWRQSTDHPSPDTYLYAVMPPSTPSPTLNLQEIVLLRGPAVEWLRGQMPEYLNLDMKRGTRAGYSQRKATEFIEHFGLGLQREDDGRTHDPLEGLPLRTGPATAGALQENTKIAPSLISFAPLTKKTHAKSVFARAHSSELKTRMNTKVRALELPTQNNLAFWYEALNELWDAETPEEQAEWYRQAEQQNNQVSGEASAAEIDSNQQLAPATLQKVLQHLLGREPNQIGEAVFHLQGAMLGQGDMIQIFSCCVGPPGAEELESYYGEYDTHLSRPFVDWAHHVLSPVTTPYVDGVTVQPNGMPVMPDLDTEELSNAQFTQLLAEYLAHAWRFAHTAVGAPTVPPIPWTKVASSPDQFVHPNRLPQNITFKKPSDMLVCIHSQHCEIEEIPEYETEIPGHAIPADGQMQKLPTETSGSNLRTTYMVTQAAQYHEIPPPNTLEAQTEATAGHTSEDNQSSRQDHVEEPHSLHEPETPLPGRSTCRATSPSAGASAADLQHELPGPSKGQAKRKTCVDKEVTQTKEPQGRGKRPRMLSEKAAIAEQERVARTSLSASHGCGGGKRGIRGSRGRGLEYGATRPREPSGNCTR
ncbi:hypothetical protein JB92DRAFT_3143274 [Gautieria morchelliformis]|nr:hypothetical protein JB92DRAFT_3143274 [Gautieria morchelliformis]